MTPEGVHREHQPDDDAAAGEQELTVAKVSHGIEWWKIDRALQAL